MLAGESSWSVLWAFAMAAKRLDMVAGLNPPSASITK
jgi:hypothetical protein